MIEISFLDLTGEPIYENLDGVCLSKRPIIYADDSDSDSEFDNNGQQFIHIGNVSKRANLFSSLKSH